MAMKRNWTVLLVAAALLAVTSPAWATHNPHLGRFMQRDPGGDGGRKESRCVVEAGAAPAVPPADMMAPYNDGMMLYQLGASAPTVNGDPTGRVIVLLAGAGQGPGTMKALGNEIKRRLRVYLDPYTEGGWPWIMTTTYAEGGLWDDYDAAVRRAYGQYVRRRRNNPCSLEQFVAIGHSSGASAIYNELWNGTFSPIKNPHNGKHRIQPAYLGFVDMVLKKRPGVLSGPTLVGKLPALTGAMHIKMPFRSPIKGIYNRNTAQAGIPVWDHVTMPFHPDTVRRFGLFAAAYYWRHVDWETRNGGPSTFRVTRDSDDGANW